MSLGDAINARLRSPRALAALVRHLLALPSDDAGARCGRAAPSTPWAPRQSTSRSAIGSHPLPLRRRQRLLRALARRADGVFLRLLPSARDRRAGGGAAREARSHLPQAAAAPGERLLDVGCGWGALIMHATQHYGVKAIGITLSDAQATLATAAHRAAGLSDRCRVEILDYRDLPAVSRRSTRSPASAWWSMSASR